MPLTLQLPHTLWFNQCNANLLILNKDGRIYHMFRKEKDNILSKRMDYI